VAYASDFATVQSVLAQVEGRFGKQLSVEERMLTELQTQTQQLEQQIAQLQSSRDADAAAYATQIAQLEAAREENRVAVQAQLEALERQAEQARADAEEQIALLREQFAAQVEAWEEQIRLLKEQITALQFIGTTITDQGGGSLPPPIEFQSLVDSSEAQVTVLQAGFTELQAELAGVRSDISALTREVRNGLEVAV
jgi:chromosome segregation ATPase